MNKYELLKRCKFYKGEENCPIFDDYNKGTLWFYEKYWVEQLVSGKSLETEIEEYGSYPVHNIDTEEQVPYSLKAVLFNSYCKTAMGTREETVAGFEKFLKKYYFYD